MKKFASLFFILTILSLSTCKSDDDVIIPGCEGTIGDELLVYGYFNDGTPTVTSSPQQSRGNISFDPAFAEPVNNGVDIVVPGVRIRTESNNYEITRFKIDEKKRGDDCFIFQNEFANDQSSFQTDIASVLVLDMSTSLQDNINTLKQYAKQYARFVVNSSPNSTVAVVFFSDRDAIESTLFFTSSTINQLDSRIDNFRNYQERTALFQAVKTGVDLLGSINFDGQKSIVAFTDGGDNDSNNPTELLGQINGSDVEKFAIGLRGSDFQENSLRSIVSEQSNFQVADDISSLEEIFRNVGRGVISVYEIRYRRSDQLLNSTESVDIRISIEAEKIE
ncbi:vWA domain-containing protein [Neolewinella agarilytica]|uniref:von Willebrand factor type A domain-containing protein n=1 Tax=Neolewinella agarilytica TaxID=478744 RepID=A0A1H9CTV5_9BACT|nr:vWA domain-containing protein [Neolewinella agarilytica]SEQ04656.1 von Willebrand factor type A domain-containing protein [Neolewinella agarilytica]